MSQPARSAGRAAQVAGLALPRCRAAASLGQVSGSSSGGGDVVVTARLTGGSGGTGFTGGNGADASLTNAVSGSTSGSLTLTQSAVADGWRFRQQLPRHQPGMPTPH